MISETVLEACMGVLCLTTLGLQVARKNRNEAILYGLQSGVVVTLLTASFLERGSIELLAVAAATLVVKAILAPLFFMRLIKRHSLTFATSTYANTALTFAVLVLILILAGSSVFAPITNIVPGHHAQLALALTTMLWSLFLIVNRKGALSQIVGVLSLENSIVVIALLAGLEQSVALQAGIVFDITVWLFIAVTMLSFVYNHHGSLDVTRMNKLKD